MTLRLMLSLLLAAASGVAAAAGGFDGIACDTNIAEALKGRQLPDGSSEATERKHKDLGLKDIGSDELDWGSQVWWRICGATYTALADQKAVIRDVLKVPSETGATLIFQGFCKGGPKDREVIAVVEDKAGATDLPAKAAWKIDDAKKRFATVPAAGMLCPRGEGIVDNWK